MDIVKGTKTLFDNKWVSVKQITLDREGYEVNYIYSSSGWCKSRGVAIMPYRLINDGKDVQILGRFEICPAHSNINELCSITGGYDNSDKFTLEQCVLNELHEEGGYIGNENDLEYLGSVRPSKSSDTTMYLYAIDIDNCEKTDAITDGTIGEMGAYCDWVAVEDLMNCKDTLLHAMFIRTFPPRLY